MFHPVVIQPCPKFSKSRIKMRSRRVSEGQAAMAKGQARVGGGVGAWQELTC